MELSSQTILQVGKAYLAKSRCDPIIDSDGVTHTFCEQTYRIRVYPKPSFVVADDDIHPIPLPDHLAVNNCYYVNNLTTDRFHWYYVDHFTIEECLT